MTDQVQVQWTADSILDFLRQHQNQLHTMGVTKLGIFGSYVRGEQTPGSDIDFLFAMEDMTFARWMDVWNFLEDRLGVRVDLVPEKDLRPELRSHIMAEVKYVSEI